MFFTSNPLKNLIVGSQTVSLTYLPKIPHAPYCYTVGLEKHQNNREGQEL